AGLSLTAASLFYMTGWTDQTGVTEIVIISVVQGFGFGLVFVPLSTVAFLTLPNHLRTDGTSMLTLMRNVASSVGISLVIAQLTQGTRYTYAVLSEHINPFNHALHLACRLSHVPPSDSAPPIRWVMVGASPRKRIDSTALTIGPR